VLVAIGRGRRSASSPLPNNPACAIRCYPRWGTRLGLVQAPSGRRRRSTEPRKCWISKTLSATPRTTSASDVATFPDRLRHVQSFTRFRSKPARGCGCLAALRPPRHLRAGRLRCSPTSLTKFLFLDNGRSTRGAELAVHALLNRCSQFDSNAALRVPVERDHRFRSKVITQSGGT